MTFMFYKYNSVSSDKIYMSHQNCPGNLGINKALVLFPNNYFVFFVVFSLFSGKYCFSIMVVEGASMYCK